ncbi:MAG: DUF2238 domain-containing protein [Erysipelothrix sp.]
MFIKNVLEMSGLFMFTVSALMYIFKTKPIDWFKIVKVASGIPFMLFPRFLDPWWSQTFSALTTSGYYLFIFASVWGGEVIGAYGRWKHFDSYLHFGSGILFAMMAWELLSMPSVQIPLALTAVLSFAIVMAIGSVWEIYEFTVDHFFDLNMQRYRDFEGNQFIGQVALYDTMKDIICNGSGALLGVIIKLLV